MRAAAVHPPAVVPVVSKPAAVPALRTTWRRSAQHKIAQWWRLIRVAAFAFAGQVGSQLVMTLLSGHVDVTHLDTKAIVSLLVGAAEVTYRQKHPALTASQVDEAPGVTIVPGELAADLPPQDGAGGDPVDTGAPPADPPVADVGDVGDVGEPDPPAIAAPPGADGLAIKVPAKPAKKAARRKP